MTRSSALEWCDRAMYYSLLPVAFFLPISTAIVEVGASICISAFFFKRMFLLWWPKDDRASPGDPVEKLLPGPRTLMLPVLFFFFATFLSVLSSQFPHESWKGFFGKTIEAVVLFFAIVESFKSRRHLNHFLALFSFSAIFIAFDGLWQHFLKTELIFGKVITYEGRITGPFGHPNDYGSYLVITALLFLGLLVWAWEARRETSAKPDSFVGGTPRFLIILIGVLMTLAALGWTFSRGAWIGFGCAAILLAFFQGKKGYITLIFLLVFWVVFSSQLGTVRNVSFITDDISMDGRLKVKRLAKLAKEEHPEKKTEFQVYLDDVFSALSRFNWTGRQVFWAETFEVFKAAPVFGTGLNSYTDAVQRYNKPWSGFYSHNCYLQMLAETGIVGLASFLWLMFVLALESWKAFFKMPNGYFRVLLASLFSGLVGFWVHGAMDTNFYSARLGNLMWILMGLLITVILLAQKENPGSHS